MRNHMMALEQALALAARGMPVYPASTKKRPTCPGGFKSATVNPAQIAKLWELWPGPLVGIATGAASGLDVLDMDPRNGGDLWFEQNQLRMPDTLVHETRSRGRHIFFRHASGLRCSQGRIADGIDVRADGGAVIWWPAAGLCVISDAPVAEWPAWLLALALPKVRPVPQESSSASPSTAYAQAALASAARRVAEAREGQRNNILNSEAYCLSRLVWAGVLPEAAIGAALTVAAARAGLPIAEAERTIRSAIRAGGQHASVR